MDALSRSGWIDGWLDALSRGGWLDALSWGDWMDALSRSGWIDTLIGVVRWMR